MTDKKETSILTLPNWDKYAKTRKLLDKVFEVDLKKGKRGRTKTSRKPKKTKGSKARISITK